MSSRVMRWRWLLQSSSSTRPAWGKAGSMLRWGPGTSSIFLLQLFSLVLLSQVVSIVVNICSNFSVFNIKRIIKTWSFQDLHTAMVACGLNPMEQEVIDMTNEVARWEMVWPMRWPGDNWYDQWGGQVRIDMTNEVARWELIWPMRWPGENWYD